MRDFFTFYENIRNMKHPFIAFSEWHILFVALITIVIIAVFQYYKRLENYRKEKFQRGMALYFIVEEVLYTLWVLWNCHDQIWTQILPLEVCSICVYVNACSVLFKKDYLRFFSGVVGLVAGLVAMIYPANISGLYSLLSYRVINFYMLHGAFVLFSLMQLQDHALLSYSHIKKNTLLVCSMFTIAFFVNIVLHSQYMFVGVPPKIVFIAALYKFTGIIFFLPVVLLAVTLLQFIVVAILRAIYGVRHEADVICYRV